MTSIELREVDSKDEWELFISSHKEANFLHSWNWADFQRSLGKTVYQSGLYDDNELKGVMITVIEDAKRGKYGAIAAGPITEWSNDGYLALFVEEMKRIADEQELVFVRLRPQVVSDQSQLDRLHKLGFKPAQMHLEAELTSQLDITRELDEIKKDFRKNTRYEIKQAKKRQITVESSSDPQTMKQFYDLQVDTAKRQGFVPFSFERLHEEFRVFADDNQAMLYSAKTKDGHLLAQALIIFYGDEASYHYGASTELGRKEPGAYALLWQAIKEAKDRGISRFNFWGVVETDDTNHRFYGVSVFKRGFRGQDVQYIHAQDLIFNTIKYAKNYGVEFARKRIRKV